MDIKLKSLGIVAGLLLLASCCPVYAASIDLSPIVNYFEPIILNGVVIVLVTGLCFIGKRVYSLLGWKWSDDEWKVVHSALLMEAQRFWAKEDTTVMAHAKFDVSDPTMAGLAQAALNTIPGYAEKLGITEEAATALLVAKLGGLQARSPAASEPPMAVAVAPAKA